jgi:hypothetical protein
MERRNQNEHKYGPGKGWIGLLEFFPTIIQVIENGNDELKMTQFGYVFNIVQYFH